MKRTSKIILLCYLALFLMQVSVYAQLDSIYGNPLSMNYDSLYNTLNDEERKQKEHEFQLISEKFTGNDNSEFLYIGKKGYTVNKSLVSNFDGYRRCLDSVVVLGMFYQLDLPLGFSFEKPYRLDFEIIDNSLYLIGLGINDFNINYLKDTTGFANLNYDERFEKFKVLDKFEKFTGREFLETDNELYTKPLGPFHKRYSLHIMKADWVNGTYLITCFGNRAEMSIVYPPYSLESIEFKDGVVISTKVLYTFFN